MTIEVELPDGTIAEFPDGTPQDVIKGALAKRFPRPAQGEAGGAKVNNVKPEGPRGPDGMTVAERLAAAKAGTLAITPERAAEQARFDSLGKSSMDQGALGAFAGNLAQGLTFGFADEIAGALGGPTEALRAKRGMDEANFPKATMGGDIAGSVAGAAVTTGLALPKLAAIAPTSMAGKIGLGAGIGATVGAGEGALSGAGYADGQNVGAEALKGGLIGAGIGGAVGGLAPVAAAWVKNLAQWAKGYDTKIIAKTLGVDKKTAAMLKSSLSGDDPAKALEAINRAGPDAMLADAGPGTKQLLDAAMQSSGSASRVAGDAIEKRAAKAATRINNIFDNLLGKADDGIKSAARGIAQRTSSARSAAYERAFAKPIDYASDAGRNVERVVKRVPRDMLAGAIKKANDAMQMDERTAKQIMASIADDGTVTFTKPLDLFQLNELKIQIGNLAREAVDNFGRPTGEGIKLKKLAGDLAGALGEAVPEYRAAVKLGGDKIAEDQALELGRKMLMPSTTREVVAEGLQGASVDARAAAKRGVRIAIDEAMANVRAVISDPNVDAREALKILSDMSSRAAKQKVKMLLGADKAAALAEAVDEARAHLELRSAVARNSATASRLATQDTAKRIVGDTILDAARDGEPINFAKRIVQTLTGGSEARKTEALNSLYTEVAKALTGPRGQEAKAAMAVIEQALKGQPIKTEEAEAIARLVASSGALTAYQSGTRYLEGMSGAPRP